MLLIITSTQLVCSCVSLESPINCQGNWKGFTLLSFGLFLASFIFFFSFRPIAPPGAWAINKCVLGVVFPSFSSPGGSRSEPVWQCYCLASSKCGLSTSIFFFECRLRPEVGWFSSKVCCCWWCQASVSEGSFITDRHTLLQVVINQELQMLLSMVKSALAFQFHIFTSAPVPPCQLMMMPRYMNVSPLPGGFYSASQVLRWLNWFSVLESSLGRCWGQNELWRRLMLRFCLASAARCERAGPGHQVLSREYSMEYLIWCLE